MAHHQKQPKTTDNTPKTTDTRDTDVVDYDDPPIDGATDWQAPPSPGHFTYGVELQFLVPFILKDSNDPHPGDPRPVLVVDIERDGYEGAGSQVEAIVLDTIRRLGHVPTWTHTGPPNPDYTEVISHMDSESQAVAYKPPYSQWVVEIDNSLLYDEDTLGGKYYWIGVRVKSSKRNWSWDNHFDQIGNVVTALRQEIRMRVAPTTFLNVHVGYSRHWEDSNDTALRRLCTMWWFIEHHIWSLTHPSRREELESNSLRAFSLLGALPMEDLLETYNNDGKRRADFIQGYRAMHAIIPRQRMLRRERAEIEVMWRADDAKILCQMMTVMKIEPVRMRQGMLTKPFPTFGRGNLGFQGFCKDALPVKVPQNNNGDTGTVEFRTMEGTLDPELIIHWVTVVIRLYAFAWMGNSNDIKVILARAGASSYDGPTLLEDIDLPIQAEYFRQKAKDDEENVRRGSVDESFVPPYQNN